MLKIDTVADLRNHANDVEGYVNTHGYVAFRAKENLDTLLKAAECTCTFFSDGSELVDSQGVPGVNLEKGIRGYQILSTNTDPLYVLFSNTFTNVRDTLDLELNKEDLKYTKEDLKYTQWFFIKQHCVENGEEKDVFDEYNSSDDVFRDFYENSIDKKDYSIKQDSSLSQRSDEEGVFDIIEEHLCVKFHPTKFGKIPSSLGYHRNRQYSQHSPESPTK